MKSKLLDAHYRRHELSINNENDNAIQFDNQMIAYLLQFAPDLYQQDKNGKNAMDWAKKTKNNHALALLQEYECQHQLQLQNSEVATKKKNKALGVIQQHEMYAETLITFTDAAMYDQPAFHHFLQTVTISLDMHRQSLNDLKSLHYPAEHYNTTFFVNRETRQGWTPLTKAAASGDDLACRLLLDLGADLHHETRLKHTPMTWASYCSQEAVCLLFLQRGVNLHYTTTEGTTALMYAMKNASKRVVGHLLQALRDSVCPMLPNDSFETKKSEWHVPFLHHILEIRDNTGKNALDYAEKRVQEANPTATEQDQQVLALLEQFIQQADAHGQYVISNLQKDQLAICRIDGCGVQVPQALLPIHENHLCLKRRVLCDQCGMQLPMDELSKHATNKCEQRRVPCRFIERGCREMVIVSEKTLHEECHCKKRMIECRLQCGQRVLYDYVLEHEALHCPERIVSCPLGCPATLKANEAVVHIRKQCLNRLLSCDGDPCVNPGGCGDQVVAKDMAFHEKHLCRKRKLPCRWAKNGCKEMIGGSSQVRQYHEATKCPYRLVTCRNECCLSGQLLACFLNQHYDWQCSLEKKKCQHDCDQRERWMTPQELLSHRLWTCSKRTTHCRFDLCNKRIQLLDPISDISLEGTTVVRLGVHANHSVSLLTLQTRLTKSNSFLTLLLEKRRQLTSNESTTGSRVDHPIASDTNSPECSNFESLPTIEYLCQWLTRLNQELETELTELKSNTASKNLPSCVIQSFALEKQEQLLLGFADGHSEWINLDTWAYQIIDATSQVFQCGDLCADMRLLHETTQCSLRLLPCPLQCGQKLQAVGIELHVKTRCNFRHVTCRRGCGLVLPFHEILTHEETTCNLRLIACPHCQQPVPVKIMEMHAARECQNVLRTCRFGCGRSITSSAVQAHEVMECPKRLIACDACQQRVWVEEIGRHQQSECSHRVYGQCTLGCMQELRIYQVEAHLHDECPKRLVTCSNCQDPVVASTIKDHQRLTCRARIVACRKGCGHHMQEQEVDIHEVTTCPHRLVACPNDCGLNLMQITLDHHIQHDCTMRGTPCRHGCGVTVAFSRLETHERRCPQRLIDCGHGAKRCARPLGLWVRNRQLTTCGAHKQTALLGAIQAHDHDLVAYLLDHVDVSEVDREFTNGFTPLTMAINVNDAYIVQLLLQHGANVNGETSRSRTPLSEACLSQNFAILELLLENRANIKAVNRHHLSVLEYATSLVTTTSPKDQIAEKVLHLLKRHIELEKDQRELFLAISCSNYEFVTRFLHSNHGLPNDADVETARILASQLEAKQTQYKETTSELQNALQEYYESAADMESKRSKVIQVTEQLYEAKTRLASIDGRTDELLAKLQVMQTSMQDVARAITTEALVSLLTVPSDSVTVLTKAICLLCGLAPREQYLTPCSESEWWAGQVVLRDGTLLQRLRNFRPQEITEEVIAAVRRECLHNHVFANQQNWTIPRQISAAPTVSVGFIEQKSDDDLHDTNDFGEKMDAATLIPTNVAQMLAQWVRTIDAQYTLLMEYQKIEASRDPCIVEVMAFEGDLVKAMFALEVAQRAQLMHQQEIEKLEKIAQRLEREVATAHRRVHVHQVMMSVTVNGHSPLSFACAIGNEAMVSVLLAHGAPCGYTDTEKHLCASLIQQLYRHFSYQKSRANSKSYRIATSFLIRNMLRKLWLYRQTHRVPLHEAVANGFPQIAALLLQRGACLRQETSVLPQRCIPGSLQFLSNSSTLPKSIDAAHQHRLNTWKLQPVGHRRYGVSKKATQQSFHAPSAEYSMTILDTLTYATTRFDCQTYTKDDGWDHALYDATRAFVGEKMKSTLQIQEVKLKEVLTKKNISKKVKERQVLHQHLEMALIERDFQAVAATLDAGALSDYETNKEHVTPLMIACVEGTVVENSDQRTVLAVAYLLDRAMNRPSVNYETTNGWTALSFAAHHGSLECMQALLERGADVNLKSRAHGHTALIKAARNGMLESIKHLLKVSELDVFVRDLDGKTALDYARERKSRDVMQVLDAAMAGNYGPTFVASNALYRMCKWGCGYTAKGDQNLAKEGMPMQLGEHEAHCCKRLVECPLHCQLASKLWYEDLEDHLNHNCTQRIVTCANAPKCKAQFPFHQMQQHERQECLFRRLECGCGEALLAQDFAVHQTQQCCRRLVLCPFQGCEKEMEAMELKLHIQAQCPYRFVRCRNGCGNDKLLEKEREEHESQVCPLRRVVCRWECNELVLAKNQQAHETTECLLRCVPCPNHCTALIAINQMAVHTTQTCPNRLCSCPAKCGRRAVLHEMDGHLQHECQRRSIQCNLCQESILAEALHSHITSTCSYRLIKCGLCGNTVVYGNLAAHKVTDCLRRPVRCKYNCFIKALVAQDQYQHETFECPYRLIACPLGCKEVIIANTVNKHEKTCAMHWVTCGNGCGIECREHEREAHEMMYCSKRQSRKRE